MSLLLEPAAPLDDLEEPEELDALTGTHGLPPDWWAYEVWRNGARLEGVVRASTRTGKVTVMRRIHTEQGQPTNAFRQGEFDELPPAAVELRRRPPAPGCDVAAERVPLVPAGEWKPRELASPAPPAAPAAIPPPRELDEPERPTSPAGRPFPPSIRREGRPVPARLET